MRVRYVIADEAVLPSPFVDVQHNGLLHSVLIRSLEAVIRSDEHDYSAEKPSRFL